jgi:hypothetical protein
MILGRGTIRNGMNRCTNIAEEPAKYCNRRRKGKAQGRRKYKRRPFGVIVVGLFFSDWHLGGENSLVGGRATAARWPRRLRYPSV